mmetsp:Transcript_29770/g.62395  ORF Transcript_29770/g.62395 Transcript_29770/m.62395 type:complete len:277 (-) Transcript_29770:3144-3974(-)
MGEVFVQHSNLRQNTNLEPTHIEEKIGIVLAVHGNKAVLPLDGCYRARKLILDVPEDRTAEVDIMLHETHPRIARPAFLVVVTNHVLIVWIRVLAEETLDEILLLIVSKAEQDVYPLDVTTVQADRMLHFSGDRIEGQKLVRLHRSTGDFAGSGKSQHEQIKNQTVILKDEGSKLQATDQAVAVQMIHVLVIEQDIVLCGHVLRNVVIDNQPKEAIQQRKIHLLVHLLKLSFHHHIGLPAGRVPHLLEVIHALAPLVHQQRRRLRVSRLHPIWKQP